MLDPESIDGLDDESVRERRREVAWLDLVGRPPPHYEDESTGPAVTPEERTKLLRAYLSDELSREAGARIFSLTQRFRSWARAELELMKGGPAASAE